MPSPGFELGTSVARGNDTTSGRQQFYEYRSKIDEIFVMGCSIDEDKHAIKQRELGHILSCPVPKIDDFGEKRTYSVPVGFGAGPG